MNLHSLLRAGIALLLLLLLAPGALFAGTESIATDAKSGIKIEVGTDFEDPPPANAVPMWVRIQNHSNRDGRWRFKFSSQWRGGDSLEKEFAVEAGQTRTFQILAPSSSSTGHSSVTVAAEGSGMPESHQAHFSNSIIGSHGSNNHGTLALSTDLAARSWEPLKKKVKDEKKGLYGTTFDPAKLPEDWRGFSGFEWVILSEREWIALAPGVRSAIRQWVGSGGHLVVAAADAATVSWNGFVFPGAGSLRYGYGDVRSISWNGVELAPETISELIKGASLPERLHAAIKPEWPFLPGLGDLKPPTFLVVSAVVGLAVLLGPINFFWLAPAARRQRLFWTTPLLSLGGSLFLFALIFLKDGLGGYGGRITVLRLLPGANEAVLYQNQMSRTGLLLSSRFSAGGDVLIHAVNIDKQSGGDLSQRRFEQHYFGDWFRSRSIQAQRIAEIRPTRTAIHQVGTAPSGAPEVVSSFDTTVNEIYVRDGRDRLWSGKNLRTGEKQVLDKANAKEAGEWWRGTIKPITGEVGRQLREKEGGLWLTRNTFHATLAPGKTPVETLRSIRWKDDRVVALGFVENAKGEEP